MIEATPNLTLHVIGAGLIGTSIALGARQAGYQVSISDVDKTQERLAQDLLRNWELVPSPVLVAVAVPPQSTAQVVAEALDRYPNSIVVDVSSTKTKVQEEVRVLSGEWNRFIPSHPIAGRETGGAASAQADLFQGRPWVITPFKEGNSSDSGLEDVEGLIEALGGTAYVISAEEHDRLFAEISHLPQIVSTALASIADGVGEGVQLAGQGFRDMTRLAESDAKLWNEIFASNKEQVLKVLKEFETKIAQFKIAIDEGDNEKIETLFNQAKKVREKISGKHGARRRDYELFRIVVDDRPGVLADLFALCGHHRINVEDLELEHSPSQETGLITLSVNPMQSDDLVNALSKSNWTFVREKP